MSNTLDAAEESRDQHSDIGYRGRWASWDGAAVTTTSSAIDSRLRLLGSLPPVVALFAVGIVIISAMALLGVVLDTNWLLFKVGEEGNVPTWFSSIQLFFIAVVLTAIVWPGIVRNRPASWVLVLVPALFVYLSLDEAAALHEQIGDWIVDRSGVGAGLPGAWVFAFVPLAAVCTVAAAVVFWPYLRGRPDVIGRAFVGLAIFGLAAAGLEVIGNLATDGSQLKKLLGFAEEVGEMVAANILLWAAILVARHEGVRLEVGEPA